MYCDINAVFCINKIIFYDGKDFFALLSPCFVVLSVLKTRTLYVCKRTRKTELAV